MRVKLNCHRPGGAPGDVVELDDTEAAPLLAYGAAHPVQDEPEPAQGAPAPATAATGPATAASKPTAGAAAQAAPQASGTPAA